LLPVGLHVAFYFLLQRLEFFYRLSQFGHSPRATVYGGYLFDGEAERLKPFGEVIVPPKEEQKGARFAKDAGRMLS
jgi:hypothetical protein